MGLGSCVCLHRENGPDILFSIGSLFWPAQNIRVISMICQQENTRQNEGIRLQDQLIAAVLIIGTKARPVKSWLSCVQKSKRSLRALASQPNQVLTLVISSCQETNIKIF